MPLPKGFKKQLKLRPQVVGPERRQDILDGIADGGTFLPRGVDYEDMDKSFINFVEEDLKIEIDGEQVPVLFLTIQRYSEFTKSWKFTDQYRNISMPFITIVRQPDPQVGTNQAGLYNIPGRQNWTYYKVPSNDGARQGIDVYKVPQPTATDITYEVRFFTNKMSDLNVLNQKVQKAFNAIQYYIWPKGHPMPVKLNNVGDESNIDDFENRRFYVQNFEMLLQGYILDEKDFEVQPTINRMMVLNEVSEDPATAEPRERKRDRGPIIPTQGNVIIRNSASQNLASVPCDTTYVVGNSNIINSGATFSVGVPATSGYTLPNITHIDSNGQPVTLPAQTPFTATTCESGSTVYNSDSGYTQQVLAGNDLTLPDTPIFSSSSGFTATTPSVTTGYTISDVTWVDSDGTTGDTEYGTLITCTPVLPPLSCSISMYSNSGATSGITATTHGEVVYLKMETTGATGIELYNFTLPTLNGVDKVVSQTGDTYAWDVDTFGDVQVGGSVKDIGIVTAYDVSPMDIFIGETPYVRPSDWLELPTITGGSSTEVINALVAVWDKSHNYITVECAGDYTVDWGDGTAPVDYGSGVVAEYDLAYSAATSATTGGFRQVLVNIVPQSGQSLTEFSITNRHSSSDPSVISYGWLDIQMQAENLDTLSLVNSSSVVHRQLEQFDYIGTSQLTSMNSLFENLLGLKSVVNLPTENVTDMGDCFRSTYSLTNIPYDMNLSAATIFSSTFFNADSIRYIKMSTPAATTFSNCFALCGALAIVDLSDTVNATAFNSMFQGAASILYVREFETSGATTFSRMFNTCTSLQFVPTWLDGSSVTVTTEMFRGAASIIKFPRIDFPLLTSCTGMFNQCASLYEVEWFDIGNVTSVSSMFSNCTSLKIVPTIDTSNVVTFTSMFSGDGVLEEIPPLITSAGTAFNSMFLGCAAIKEVPALDTGNGTTFNRMFQNCNSLTKIPSLNSANVTNFGEFARSSNGIVLVDDLEWSGATNVGTIFVSALNISRIIGFNCPITVSLANLNIDTEELEEIYTALPTVVGQTITVTGNPGAATADTTIATGKGWSVIT